MTTRKQTTQGVSRRGFLQIAGITGGLALTSLVGSGASASTGEGPGEEQSMVRATRQPADWEERPLPAPRTTGTVALETTLLKRRSQRQFAGQAITQEQLSQLLWAAQGVTDPSGKRTAPSAIALYPIDLYAFTAGGTFLYNPTNHSVFVVSNEDLRPAISGSAAQANTYAQASAVFVPVASYDRLSARVQGAMASRYAYLEIGHIAQNLLLEAVALGLVGVPQAGIQEAKIREVLGLAENQEPVYGIPIGKMAG
jgi:SagB-type dehydrogenase family enzyme